MAYNDQQVRTDVGAKLVEAARALVGRTYVGTDAALRDIEDVADSAGRAAVGHDLGELFMRVADRLWESGWRPAEVVRVLRRSGSAASAELGLTALAGSSACASPPPAGAPRAWREEVARLGIRRWYDPYASAKSFLLSAVAAANGARCVWYKDLALMAVIGFAADLDAIELLFTSLLVQGNRAMLGQGSVSDRYGRSQTRSYRQSFLLAFASRIRERLAAAAASARSQAEEDLGRSLVPVLARQADDVDDAVAGLFPRLGSRRGPSATNEAGWRAGRAAGDLANLHAAKGTLARTPP